MVRDSKQFLCWINHPIRLRGRGCGLETRVYTYGLAALWQSALFRFFSVIPDILVTVNSQSLEGTLVYI